MLFPLCPNTATISLPLDAQVYRDITFRPISSSHAVSSTRNTDSETVKDSNVVSEASTSTPDVHMERWAHALEDSCSTTSLSGSNALVVNERQCSSASSTRLHSDSLGREFVQSCRRRGYREARAHMGSTRGRERHSLSASGYASGEDGDQDVHLAEHELDIEAGSRESEIDPDVSTISHADEQHTAGNAHVDSENGQLLDVEVTAEVGDEEVHTDRWLLSEAIAVGQSRSLALEPRFAALGFLPYGGAAAHLLHDGSPPESLVCGQILSPLPLPTCTGLPFHIIGDFDLISTDRSVPFSSTSAHADDLQRIGWNCALFSCIEASLLTLLKALPQHLRALKREPSVGGMYMYWPTAPPLAHEELGELLIRPLYNAAASSALFLAQQRESEGESSIKGELRKLSQGYVCPSTLDPRIDCFVRQHFTIFDVPSALADQLISTAPSGIRPFTPCALRQYLKRKLSDPVKRDANLLNPSWSELFAANFALDMLAFCLQDLTQLAPSESIDTDTSFNVRLLSDGMRVKRVLRTDRTSEIEGLFLLPLATGAMSHLGCQESYIVASRRQQALLPHLKHCFVNAQCVEHKEVGHLFLESREFLKAARLREFDLELLSSQMKVTNAPSQELLHAFWHTVLTQVHSTTNGIGSEHVVQLSTLFASRPLLPIRNDSPQAVAELSRTLVLPQHLLLSEIAEPSDSILTPQAAAPDQPHTALLLLDLLEQLNMPLLHPDFVFALNSQLEGLGVASTSDSLTAAEAAPLTEEGCCGYFEVDATSERHIPSALIDKLASNAHNLQWSRLTLRGARALVHLFAETAAASGSGQREDASHDV